LFFNTFKVSYFEYLIGSSSQLFIDVVIIAEKIEQTILKRKVLLEKGRKSRFIISKVDTKPKQKHLPLI
jgi:hypothetical protein